MPLKEEPRHAVRGAIRGIWLLFSGFGLVVPKQPDMAVEFRYFDFAGGEKMSICDRCGWLIPTDCTCRRHAGQLAAVRVRSLVAERHQQSVARAYESGWALRFAPAGPGGKIAG